VKTLYLTYDLPMLNYLPATRQRSSVDEITDR